eukprot:COSAG01_NODE_2911_length_6875_cov_93.023318_3_plen_601_part_00
MPRAETEHSLLGGSSENIRGRGACQCAQVWHGTKPYLFVVVVQALFASIFYASFKAGPNWGEQSDIPNRMEYLAVPMFCTVLVAHWLTFDHSDEWQRWAAARLCCSSVAAAVGSDTHHEEDGDEDAKRQHLVKSVPTADIVFHHVLFGVVFIVGWRPDYQPLQRFSQGLIILVFGVVTFLILFSVRRSAIALTRDENDLQRFCQIMRRWSIVSVFLQFFIFMKYVNWSLQTVDALKAALDNGFPYTSDSDSQNLWSEVPLWPLLCSCTCIWTCFLWMGVASTLHVVGIFGPTSTGYEKIRKTFPYQLLLTIVAVVSAIIAYSWTDGVMALGVRRFQKSDGSPCDDSGDCDLTPRLWSRVIPSAPFIPYGCVYLQAVWWVIFGMLGWDIQQQKGLNNQLKLPKGKKYHFFICHHQSSGGNQARNLYDQLTGLGCKVWYDNAQPAEERVLAGMKRGVKSSMTLLIFLSGRKETEGEPDRNGQYEGPFTRWFCHEEMITAQDADCHIMGVMETDRRHGVPDFALEKQRALSGGEHGGRIHVSAEQNIKLLDNVCFLPRRTQAHEVGSFLQEILAQGVFNWHNSPFRGRLSTLQQEDTTGLLQT